MVLSDTEKKSALEQLARYHRGQEARLQHYAANNAWDLTLQTDADKTFEHPDDIARPKTTNGVYICFTCDARSVYDIIQDGKKIGQECELCGRKYTIQKNLLNDG